ncbi:MAG TPA: hypothetical protein VIY47_14310, partial [Ignavibacteriaceae bacterium]
VLAMTRIPTLTYSLPFHVVLQTKSKAVIKHLMADIKLRQDVTPLNKAMRQRKVSILTATSTGQTKKNRILPIFNINMPIRNINMPIRK